MTIRERKSLLNSMEDQYLINKFARMDEKIDKLFAKLGDLENSIIAFPEKIFEKADGRYADKETERTVRRFTNWVLITALTVIGGLITTVVILIQALTK